MYNLDTHITKAVYAELIKIVDDRKLNKIQIAHFLSQCHHESLGFTCTQENLNYSAKGLLQTFPKYFNKAESEIYARKPIKIANKVYANRMGNRDEKSGDGWLHRGKGFIQLTGKNNQTNFLLSVGLDNSNTDVIATDYPLQSAAWFFDVNNLWLLCKDDSKETVEKLTHKINGGVIGLKERIKLFCKYWDIINAK